MSVDLQPTKPGVVVSNAKKLGYILSTALLGVVFVPAVLLTHGPHTTDARLGAVLAFVAALAGTVVAAISLVVSKQNQDRLEQHRDEEFRRQKLEAAMRAGQLLAAGQRGAVTPASMASGLLALSELGQPELAVALLVDLWTADGHGVSNEIAILIIDKALRSDSAAAQLVAAELLCRHSHDLSSTQSLDWPSAIEGCWVPQFSRRTKLLLVEALVSSSAVG